MPVVVPNSALPAAGPLIGIDWGERRIGVAVSDPDRRLAVPLATLTRRTGRRFPLARLRPLLDERRPAGIVLGLPLTADGQEGPEARAVRELASLLEAKTGLPVICHDERMSTARVLRDAGPSRPDRDDVDQLAATVLLQQYLDQHRP